MVGSADSRLSYCREWQISTVGNLLYKAKTLKYIIEHFFLNDIISHYLGYCCHYFLVGLSQKCDFKKLN